jgi:hypothetical protein
MNEALTVNGVDIGSYAYMTTDVSGLFTVPARRGEDDVVAGRHGVVTRPHRKFDAAEIVLPMWVVGALADGSIPVDSNEQDEFYKRRDELLNLFYADNTVLAFTRPDGTTRSTRVEVAEVLDFTRRYAEPLAQVSIALKLPDVFWRDTAEVSQTITGATGTVEALTVFAGSTAPIADTRITFFGPVSNPRISIGERWLQYNGIITAGRELILEAGSWSASSGAGELWAPNVRQVYREPGPAWLELPPSQSPLQVTFTHTGGDVGASVEFAGRKAYLSP